MSGITPSKFIRNKAKFIKCLNQKWVIQQKLGYVIWKYVFLLSLGYVYSRIIIHKCRSPITIQFKVFFTAEVVQQKQANLVGSKKINVFKMTIQYYQSKKYNTFLWKYLIPISWNQSGKILIKLDDCDRYCVVPLSDRIDNLHRRKSLKMMFRVDIDSWS